MPRRIFSITQGLSLPCICALCSQYQRMPHAVCGRCTSLMKQIKQRCCYCAYPLTDTALQICGQCIKNKPAFDNTITAYYFEEPLRTLLHQFKDHCALHLRGYLAQLMLDALQIAPHQTIHCLVPVPMHPKRLQERGFNQAAVLTKLLAKQLKVPYAPNLCRKIRQTQSQADLPLRQRKTNLRGCFSTKKTPPLHITLVDDILTTGSTANELANVLKQNGAKQVDVWCCARAINY